MRHVPIELWLILDIQVYTESFHRFVIVPMRLFYECILPVCTKPCPLCLWERRWSSGLTLGLRGKGSVVRFPVSPLEGTRFLPISLLSEL